MSTSNRSISRFRTFAYLAAGAVAAALVVTLAIAAPISSTPPSSPGEMSHPAPAGAELSGEEAPDFSLERMNGGTFTLSEHRGEVVIINFWATWCAPCRKEIPDFISVQEEYGDEGLTFVGVSLDEDGFEVVEPFAEEMGINYPLVVDDGAVAAEYGGVFVIPTTFIIDRGGKIAYMRPGLITESEIQEHVEPLLAAR